MLQCGRYHDANHGALDGRSSIGRPTAAATRAARPATAPAMPSDAIVARLFARAVESELPAPASCDAAKNWPMEEDARLASQRATSKKEMPRIAVGVWPRGEGGDGMVWVWG